MNQHPTDWLKIFIVQCYKQFQMIKSYSFIYLMLFISLSLLILLFASFIQLFSIESNCKRIQLKFIELNWWNWNVSLSVNFYFIWYLLFLWFCECSVEYSFQFMCSWCVSCIVFVTHKLLKLQDWMLRKAIQHNVFNGWYACTFLLSFWFVSSFSEWNFFILVWLSSFDWLDCCLTLTHWFVDSTKSLVPWSLLSSFSAWQCNKLIFCHC